MEKQKLMEKLRYILVIDKNLSLINSYEQQIVNSQKLKRKK